MTEPLTIPSMNLARASSPHEPVLIMASGSFLDLNGDELYEVCLATDHLSGFGMRITGEHHLERSRWVEWGNTIQSSGMKIFDVEVYRIGSQPGPHIDSVDDLIQMAAAIGAEKILVVGDSREIEVVERELRRIVPMAADFGLGVGLEYMAWTMPRTLSEARYLANTTGCQLVVDVLHHTRVGATVDELALLVDDGVLGWVQVCDAQRAKPEHIEALIHEARHGRLVPGHGELPLDELLAVVPNDTVFSIEVQSDELLFLEPRQRARLLVESTREVLRSSFSR